MTEVAKNWNENKNNSLIKFDYNNNNNNSNNNNSNNNNSNNIINSTNSK